MTPAVVATPMSTTAINPVPNGGDPVRAALLRRVVACHRSSTTKASHCALPETPHRCPTPPCCHFKGRHRHLSCCLCLRCWRRWRFCAARGRRCPRRRRRQRPRSHAASLPRRLSPQACFPRCRLQTSTQAAPRPSPVPPSLSLCRLSPRARAAGGGHEDPQAHRAARASRHVAHPSATWGSIRPTMRSPLGALPAASASAAAHASRRTVPAAVAGAVAALPAMVTMVATSMAT